MDLGVVDIVGVGRREERSDEKKGETKNNEREKLVHV